MIEDQEIQSTIKKVVLEHLPDAEVRLFGSRVRGTANTDSDHDILIITEQLLSSTDKFPIKSSIRKELLHYGIRTDILIQSRKDISIKRKLPGHIIRNIMKEAIIL